MIHLLGESFYFSSFVIVEGIVKTIIFPILVHCTCLSIRRPPSPKQPLNIPGPSSLFSTFHLTALLPPDRHHVSISLP
jgi:hypothetical protein